MNLKTVLVTFSTLILAGGLAACDLAFTVTPTVQVSTPSPSAPVFTATPYVSPTRVPSPAQTPTAAVTPQPTIPTTPPSLANPHERQALANGVKFVTAWEYSAYEYRSASWAWSTYGLAFVYKDAIWVAQGPQFQRRLVTLVPRFEQPFDSGPWPKLAYLTWSPGGTYIAFSGSTPQSPLSLFVVRSDGSGTPKLLGGEQAYPTKWSNARTLFYNEHVTTDCNPLYRVDVETGERKTIDENGWGYYWTPNQDRILVVDRFSGLRLIDLDGRDLGHVGDKESRKADDWAADGNRFLFSQWERVKIESGSGWGRPELWVWDVLRCQGHRVFSNAWDGAWSPDNRYIACWVAGTPIRDSAGHITGTNYTFGQPALRSLGLIESQTGLMKTLIPVESDMTNPSSSTGLSLFWLPDGTLAYGDAQKNLWLLPMSTLQPYRVADEQELDRLRAWSFGEPSPDGTRRIYRDGQGDWWLLTTSTQPMRRLTQGLEGIAGKSTLIWSPDGRYLALITQERILILEP